MATSVISNTYSGHQSQYSYFTQPQAPPSPPMDDNKCSLPSISNLLGLADQGSPTSETAPPFPQQGQQQAPQQCRFFNISHWQQKAPPSNTSTAQSRPETRPNSSHYNAIQAVRGGMPPTPPMTSEASFDGYNSPSAKSVSQLPGSSGYYFESTPPMSHIEPEHRPHSHMAHSVARVPVQAPFAQPAYAAPGPYGMAPANPMTAYYPTMQPTPPPQPQISGLYYQRPLPQVSRTVLLLPPGFQDRLTNMVYF